MAADFPDLLGLATNIAYERPLPEDPLATLEPTNLELSTHHFFSNGTTPVFAFDAPDSPKLGRVFPEDQRVHRPGRRRQERTRRHPLAVSDLEGDHRGRHQGRLPGQHGRRLASSHLRRPARGIQRRLRRRLLVLQVDVEEYEFGNVVMSC